MKKLIKPSLCLSLLLCLAPATILAQAEVQESSQSLSRKASQALSDAEFSISYEMSFTDSDSLDGAMGFVAVANWNMQMNNLAAEGNSDALKFRSLSLAEQEYFKSYNKDAYKSMSLSDQAQVLADFVGSELNEDIAPGILAAELALRDMKNNPTNWRHSLDQVKDDLSFEEKIHVASRLGGDFLSDYDSERADGKGPHAGGIVSIEEMLENLKNSEAGGVCRDIALAQAQVLRVLGVEKNKVYIMGYATATAHHAVLAVQDPNNPKKVVTVNYSATNASTGVSGGSALQIEGSLVNIGAFNRIYDADGKPVEIITSEIGQILREVSGGQQKIDNQMPTYTLKKVVFKTKWADGVVFEGDSSLTGDHYTGVALNREWQGRDLSHTQVGIAFINREGNKRANESIDQQMLYMHLRQWLEKSKALGPVKLTGFGGVEAEATLMNTKVVRRSDGLVKAGSNVESVVGTFVGARAETQTSDGKTRVSSEIRILGYANFKNVAAGTDGGLTLAFDNLSWDNDIEHDFTPRVVGHAKLQIVHREVGKTVSASVGLGDKKAGSAFDLNYLRPLDDIPYFFEGSTETYSMSASRQWERRHAARKGAGSKVYVEVRHEKDTGRNQGWVGFQIKW